MAARAMCKTLHISLLLCIPKSSAVGCLSPSLLHLYFPITFSPIQFQGRQSEQIGKFSPMSCDQI